MSDKIDSILEEHRKSQPEDSAGRFYQLIRVDGSEHFLEVQFRDGIRTAFAYERLSWFNYSPETSMLDLNFMGVTVSIEGRGLNELFQALKGKKVSWVKEADTDLQDSAGNPCYIKEITITPPDDGFENESEGES
jgi:hypothetical protein